MAKDTHVSARLNDDRIDVIDMVADERDSSRAAVLRDMIDDFERTYDNYDMRDYADERGLDVIDARHELAQEQLEEQDSQRNTNGLQQNQQQDDNTRSLVELLSDNLANMYAIVFILITEQVASFFTMTFGQGVGGWLFAGFSALVILAVVEQNIGFLPWIKKRRSDSDGADEQTAAVTGN